MRHDSPNLVKLGLSVRRMVGRIHPIRLFSPHNGTLNECSALRQVQTPSRLTEFELTETAKIRLGLCYSRRGILSFSSTPSGVGRPDGRNC